MKRLMNYRRHGGLHFITIGRFGMSWYVKRWKPTVKRPIEDAWEAAQ